MGNRRVLSGKEVCQIFEKHGFVGMIKRGRHIAMQRKISVTTVTVSVPGHKELRAGTSLAIIC